MATITTIQATDQPKDSRSVINTNFTNLNNDKLESGDNISELNNDSNFTTETYVDNAVKLDSNDQTGTTYTLVLSDNGKVVTLDNGSAITLTVPPNSSVAFPVGAIINLEQLGAGQVTVEGDTGVTIRSKDDNLKLTGQYSPAYLRKLDTNERLLAGDLTS